MAKKSRPRRAGPTKTSTESKGPHADYAPAPTLAIRGSSAQALGAEAIKPTRDQPTPDQRSSNRAGQRAEPFFWFGFAIGWPKLVVFRFTIFMMLAVDALLQISHAPRYGAGGFNVGHMAWLSGLAPGRTTFEMAQLTIALCLTAAAVGAATRIVLPLATGLYAWVYFSSQLDSYQHHYLVAMMLLLLCFVDWRRPELRHAASAHAATTPATQNAEVIGGWPLRLLLIELAIMYFWAAISKTEASWLDGRTLGLQIHGAMRSMIEHTGGFAFAAKLVLIAEFMLAASIWHRRGWWVALPLGIFLHVGILWSGLEIGLFAELMLGLYLLLIPDRIFNWAAAKLQRVASLMQTSITAKPLTWGLAVAAFAIAIGFAALTRMPHAIIAAVAGAAIVSMANLWQQKRHGRISIIALLSPALATLLWLGIDRTSDTMYDYYRFWAGAESRIGDVNRAKTLYRHVTVLFDQQENGYYQLAKLQIASGNPDEQQQAVAHLHRAQQLAPQRARAFVVEAKLLNSQGKLAAALDKAQAGAAAEPTNVEALTLVRQLQQAQPAGLDGAPRKAMPSMPGKRPVTSDTDDNDR